MSFPPEHEIYRRRFSRNLGVGLTLAAFIGVVFALTVVKVTYEQPGRSPAEKAQTGTVDPKAVAP